MTSLIAHRLQPLLANNMGQLETLRGASLVLTGATGFFGVWVLSAIDLLNRAGTGVRVHCISRDAKRFESLWPELAQRKWLSWSAWSDGRFGPMPRDAKPTHVLHMAASSDARVYASDPHAASASMICTTHQSIALARMTGAHLHFVSSGAVYGARTLSDGPSSEAQIARFAPEPASRGHAYGNAKRMCESLVACALDNYCISRPFAFLGPLLPLDQHFAAGNFIADAACDRAVVIKGDGTPLRSYMHPADLVLWLLLLLAKPALGQAVNVGSPDEISIAGVADRISSVAGSPQPQVLGCAEPSVSPPAYWPDISHAKSLGLELTLSLEDCIRDTLQWAQSLHPAGFPHESF